MTDIIQAVRQFTEAIGCTTDQFNVRQTALYIGLQLEEMAEKLEAVGAMRGGDMEATIWRLRDLSVRFKCGQADNQVAHASRAAMLDADIDLAWVTIGSALSQGADVEGAAGEVARANLSKLVDCEEQHLGIDRPISECPKCKGTLLYAIKDANGKVKKPEGWAPPNIEPFVCKVAANG